MLNFIYEHMPLQLIRNLILPEKRYGIIIMYAMLLLARRHVMKYFKYAQEHCSQISKNICVSRYIES